MQISAGRQIHEAKSAGIVVADGKATIGLGYDMVVKFLGRRIYIINPEPARHAQVRYPGRVVVKMNG
tara:strand:- start:218 stop:418 length:201 start_codon:yes stop_codon:yes gene_type:complete